jgi:hypothetical protein
MKFFVVIVLVMFISNVVLSTADDDCDFNGIIEKYRNKEEIAHMSLDDQRNTVIVEINKANNEHIPVLQGKSNCQLRKIVKNLEGNNQE